MTLVGRVIERQPVPGGMRYIVRAGEYLAEPWDYTVNVRNKAD